MIATGSAAGFKQWWTSNKTVLVDNVKPIAIAAGAAIGLAMGGPMGAAAGAVFGRFLGEGVRKLATGEEANLQIITASALLGGFIGLKMMGPLGLVIGAGIGVAISGIATGSNRAGDGRCSCIRSSIGLETCWAYGTGNRSGPSRDLCSGCHR